MSSRAKKWSTTFVRILPFYTQCKGCIAYYSMDKKASFRGWLLKKKQNKGKDANIAFLRGDMSNLNASQFSYLLSLYDQRLGQTLLYYWWRQATLVTTIKVHGICSIFQQSENTKNLLTLNEIFLSSNAGTVTVSANFTTVLSRYDRLFTYSPAATLIENIPSFCTWTTPLGWKLWKLRETTTLCWRWHGSKTHPHQYHSTRHQTLMM